MKNKKKTLLMSLAAVLLVAAGVFGTLAYLTSTTETVENTFTVGNVNIDLDEAAVDVYGNKLEGEDRRTANEYKLIPGYKYVKDPKVTVKSGSDKSYVYVKVVNTLGELETAEADETIAAQLVKNKWELLEGNLNVYRHTETHEGEKVLPVFDTFKLKEGPADGFKEDAPESITIKAFAIQADDITQDDADAEALKVLNP